MNIRTGKIDLFVPGRLCLFGEHTDWAGMYRSVNSNIEKGLAIVTGIEQGIYAKAQISDRFIVESPLPLYEGNELDCPMENENLLKVAQQGGFFSYVAGVASYINENYSVGGVKITVTRMDLPVKSGLSSSAAICVLVARAFNILYDLKMNTKGEMQAAFRGEQRTPSRCGRLDQACAYGVKPVLMEFDGVEIDSRELHVGASFTWVIADLCSHKNTVKILADLNKAFPFAESERDSLVQEALGKDNQAYVKRAVRCLEEGDAEGLGTLMKETQENFDRKVMLSSTELIAPVLHSLLKDTVVQRLTLGGKGVGSQGDGTVQFLVRGSREAEELQRYLKDVKGMPSFTLTLHPGQTVKRAVIPLAGFGTRVFPASKCVKKCFLPVLDQDGVLKPALLIILEQLTEAGIDEICLVIGDNEQEEFDRFFGNVPRENYEKLPEDKKKLQWEITEIARHVTYVIQKERLGFGHAVWLCREFTREEPVLLLLGDFLYRSDLDRNCSRQVMDAFIHCGKTLVSITEIPLPDVVHYGILSGQWENNEETMMKVDRMVEKPTDDYAREYLGVLNARGEKKYYATFGQYVLTPAVFRELDLMVRSFPGGRNQAGQTVSPEENDGNTSACADRGIFSSSREIELTSALQKVQETEGMAAFTPRGRCFDIGLPDSYYRTMMEYGKP